MDVLNGYLVFYGLPYLNSDAALVHGDLVFKLDLVTSAALGLPGDHQAYWRGSSPSNVDGSRVPLGGGKSPLTISEGFATTRSFSVRPKPKENYESYEEKAESYFALITAPAVSKYPDAVPLRGLELKSKSVSSPLKLIDTFSAKAGILDLSLKLLGLKIGIVGLGGTGIYVLDYVSKTHLAEVHLYDDDIVKMGNAFRFPGALPSTTFGSKKVEVAAQIYSEIHGQIIPHAEKVTSRNVESLKGLDYVFVCVDDAPSRALITQGLNAMDIPFSDVGMGLNREQGRLSGLVRATEVGTETFEKLKGTGFLPFEDPTENEYRHQAQIGELNALNAALAVIQFKKRFGFYFSEDRHSVALFDLANMEMNGITV